MDSIPLIAYVAAAGTYGAFFVTRRLAIGRLASTVPAAGARSRADKWSDLRASTGSGRDERDDPRSPKSDVDRTPDAGRGMPDV